MNKVTNLLILLLGIIALSGGILFLGVALILFLTGDADVAGIFILPGVAVVYAGVWLLRYRKVQKRLKG